MNKKKNPTLADQLREAIENSGLNINALANAADIPQPVLYRFVKGERDVRLETASEIANFFGMRLTRPHKV